MLKCFNPAGSASSSSARWAKRREESANGAASPLQQLSNKRRIIIKMSTMNQNEQTTDSGRGPIAAAVYYLLNILLFPITLIGYVLMSVSFYAGRKSSVSGTALAPLTGRWLLHNLGSRQDEPANRLMMAMAGLPVSLTLGPMIFAHRVSGFVPKAYRYPFQGEITLGNQGAARQTLFDSIVENYLPKITQFVILGAGFDTRALRLKGMPKYAPVRFFEIDTPPTLAFKRQRLARAGIDSTGITFVPADFEKEDWLTRLIKAGFNPGEPALFIWEGVVPYLDKEAVKDALRKIASTAKGSVVAFDYFTSEVLESRALSMRSVRASLNAGGEPLKFGVDSTPPSRERLAELLQSCGLTLIEQLTLGQETQRKRAWGGFAIATVK
jgi:methyltransferase (TIGR00027 family)